MNMLFANGENGEVPKRVLRSLNLSLDLLEVLAEAGRPLGASELAGALGLSKAGVHAILTNLEARGYLARDADNTAFRLGSRLWELGQQATPSLDLAEIAHEVLLRLTEATGENSHVASYCRGGEILFLDRVTSSHPVQVMIVPVGKRAPATTTALGHVLLGHQPNAELEEICRRLQSLTQRTITDPESLKRAIAEAREQGFALRRGLHHEDVVAIAAPVRDHRGAVVAAVGVFGPAYRFEPDPAMAMVPVVLKAAGDITQKLTRRRPVEPIKPRAR